MRFALRGDDVGRLVSELTVSSDEAAGPPFWLLKPSGSGGTGSSSSAGARRPFFFRVPPDDDENNPLALGALATRRKNLVAEAPMAFGDIGDRCFILGLDLVGDGGNCPGWRDE